MKKLFLSLFAAAAMAGVANAEVSDVALTYCNGELPSKGTLSYGEADAWVSGAIYIPQGTIATFAGNEIVGVNAGLASKLNIDKLTVWVRTDLNGENLVEQTITNKSEQSIVKGWNTVKFDTPFSISADLNEGVYIGYSFHQPGSAFGVAAIKTPTPYGFYVQFGEDNEWEDRSEEGTICIEGLLQGENLPKINLSLSEISIPDVYIIDKGTMEISGKVRNLATWTVTGFNVSAEVNGKRVATAQVDDEIPYNTTGEFTVTLPLGITKIGDGTGEVTVVVDGIAEGDDEDPTDNSLTAGFNIVQHDFTHKIFVEEFTTEQCPNCPRVGNYIHESLENPEFAEDVLVVCHHSGYYTDWLTASFDEKYTWLFNDGGSMYAPAMVIDRVPQSEKTAVFSVSSKSDMEAKWRKQLAKPALVSLDITGVYDDDDPKKVKVIVNGSKSIARLCDNPTITVFIVENDIKARSQAGASGEYIHYHVGRAVNSVWGEPIEFDGDDYTYECEFNLNQTWVLDNLQVIAMIANYNQYNATDCEVKNAASLNYTDFVSASGVEGITSDFDKEAEIYTISGMKVNGNLAPGIYIRRHNGKAEKFIVK